LAGVNREIVVRISRRKPSGETGRTLNDDTKMGLVLLGVAFLALAGYTLFEFAGFIADVISH
jgi:hypothetical protein